MLLRLIHSQLGILIAPFIFIAALTGVLYGLTPQLEAWYYQKQLVAVHQPDQIAKLLSQQVAAAMPYLPEHAKVFAVRTPINSDTTTRVMYQMPMQPERMMAIFVNPYTLKVQGQLTTYGTSGVLPIRIFLDQLHRQLLLGEYGRVYAELAASWLGLFALTGLLQWWQYRHKKSTAHVNSKYAKWHYGIGLAILPMLLFFSITGLTWSKWTGANIAQLRHLINSDTPTLQLSLMPMPVSSSSNADPHAQHHMQIENMQATAPTPLNLNYFDDILRIARAQGLTATALQIKPSARNDQAWSIEEMNHRAPIQIDAIAVDMSQHKIVDRLRFDKFPLSAKLTRWGVDLHIGVLFGKLNQAVLVISGLMIMLLIIYAYRAWWSRQHPLQMMQHANQSMHQLWQNSSVLTRLLAIIAMIGLYFLVPVWVLSVVCLQLVVFIYSSFTQRKIH